jgi:hypothetical protein
MPRNDPIRPRPAPFDDRAVITLRRAFQALLKGKRPTMYQRQLRDLAAVLTCRAQAIANDPHASQDELAKSMAMARKARLDMLLAFGLPKSALKDVHASVMDDLDIDAVLPTFAKPRRIEARP